MKKTHFKKIDQFSIKRFQKNILSEWKEVLHLRKKVLKKSKPDDIHDLRIILRRFRLSQKLAKYFTSQPTKKLRKNLRTLIKSLGTIRNIDEALVFFSKNQSDAKITEKLVVMRFKEFNKIKKPLKNFKHRNEDMLNKMLQRLKAMNDPIDKKILKSISADIKELMQFVTAKMPLAVKPTQRNLRHLIRKNIRKLRYYLETFSIIFNHDYASIIKKLKHYQTILGQLNDIVIFECLCKNMKLENVKSVKQKLLTHEKRLLKKFLHLKNKQPLRLSISLLWPVV